MLVPILEDSMWEGLALVVVLVAFHQTWGQNQVAWPVGQDVGYNVHCGRIVAGIGWVPSREAEHWWSGEQSLVTEH